MLPHWTGSCSPPVPLKWKCSIADGLRKSPPRRVSGGMIISYFRSRDDSHYVFVYIHHIYTIYMVYAYSGISVYYIEKQFGRISAFRMQFRATRSAKYMKIVRKTRIDKE